MVLYFPSFPHRVHAGFLCKGHVHRSHFADTYFRSHGSGRDPSDPAEREGRDRFFQVW
jgi:hypothetical protein